MTDTLIPAVTSRPNRVTPKPALELAKYIVTKLLSKLETGQITLRDGDVTQTFGHMTSEYPLAVTIFIRHPGAYSSIAFGGSIGAAEAFMFKQWETDDLTRLVRIVIRNKIVFNDMEKGLSRVAAPFYKAYHYLRRNSVSGSRKNIQAHYDLGNDFYRLFLDDTLTYSSGIFESPGDRLKQAAIAKYDRICRKLRLSENDHVVEIGTGWGGFALHAVKHYGCRVTTTTLSDQQFDLAEQRFKQAGIDHKVTLLKSDYRNLQGKFDKLVSIEMIEAVGHQYLDTFMAKCADLLKPTGLMAIQSITIADWAYDEHKKEVDFIKRYIFPGSCIPSVTAISNALATGTDLRLYHLDDITPHYATTLRMWRKNFHKNIEQVKALGFNDVFNRMWTYYLQYCEAGFRERYLGSVQMVFTKPLAKVYEA